MLVHETADSFWATISALRSLGESEGVWISHFTPGVSVLHLLLKSSGSHIPEVDVWEELDAVHIHVQVAMQLRLRRRDQDVEKHRPLPPHFVVSVARGPDVAKLRSLTELSSLRQRVETFNAPRGPLHYKRCQLFGHSQRNCGYAPRCIACREAHPSGKCVTPKQQLKCCNCGRNHIVNYRGCSKWKEANAAAVGGARPKGWCLHTRFLHPKWLYLALLSRRDQARAETTLSKETAWSRLRQLLA
jgi:hypothetical protein